MTYLKLIPYAIILLLAIAFLWVWRDKDNAEANLLAAQQVHVADAATHADDQATIKRITSFRADDDRILTNFTNDLADINSKFDATTDAIDNLRQTDEAVRTYLNTPIPPSLRDLLNGVREQPATGPAGQAPN